MSQTLTWDPYAVLGLSRDATPLQVARAHRRLAKRHHPDLHPDAADTRAMHRINEAWRILSAPSLRADFDRRHPAAGLPAGTVAGASAAMPIRSANGHWTANREPIPRAAVSPRSYPEWRAAASGGDASSATWSTHGYARPAAGSAEWTAKRARNGAAAQAPNAAPREFRDSGWAAIVVAAVLVAFLLLAAGLGSQYWASTRGDLTPAELRLRDRD